MVSTSAAIQLPQRSIQSLHGSEVTSNVSAVDELNSKVRRLLTLWNDVKALPKHPTWKI